MRKLLPIILCVVTLAGCGLLPEQKDKTKDWSAQKLFSEATAELKDGNYDTAIDYYQKLESRYPFGRFAMQAQLNLGYAYYRKDEPESAIAAADRFLKLHPDHPAAAYAMYLKGLTNFNKNVGFLNRFIPTDNSQRDPGSTSDAYRDFEELIRRYPDSAYSEDALRRMFYLRNNLARHEVHAARYYMDRGSYIAAAERAKEVLQKYQRSPSARDALEIMIEAYDRMELPELADDTRRVLALNDSAGNFAPVAREGTESTLIEDIWNYLELDE